MLEKFWLGVGCALAAIMVAANFVALTQSAPAVEAITWQTGMFAGNLIMAAVGGTVAAYAALEKD